MIDLAGSWQLVDAAGTYDLPITIPGDVHTALLENDVIPDPFVGRDENLIQWVGRRGWTIRREFDIAADELPRGDRRLLEIDTVDTVAEVVVNGAIVARSRSMFVPLRVDVGAVLRDGTNEIEVRFDSPEGVAAKRAAALPYPVPHQIYPNQSMHRNLLRKVQCHGSWDWGIAMMVTGLYGEVRIRTVPVDAIRAVWGVPRRSTVDSVWTVPVTIEWDRPDVVPGDCGYPEEIPPVSVAIVDERGVVVAAVSTDHDAESETAGGNPSGPDGEGAFAGLSGAGVSGGFSPVRLLRSGALQVTPTVENPAIWWPAGYGEQPLYEVIVRLGEDERRFRTAFREIEVVNEPDEWGRSFHFRVNRRAIWAKGANWIPVDAFPSRQTPEVYRRLLTDAREANMNMIRVWGGGQYEPDHFYDLCDELGLLVWQDFMFSCSLYPSQSFFLDEVREEVQAQMRRLVSHPSIAIWCGNNENIGALGWFDESIAHPGRYLIDYDRLNNGVIADEVRRVDDTRVFWPSSPAAGEGDFSDNWHDDSAGDMHYWSVWHEGKPFSAYYEVTPRFCSEFGFQSFPGLPTIRSFAREEQLNPTAPELEHHQRHPRGNTVILETISRYFRFPFDFADFVYLSQVQQAIAISTAVTYWRSRRPVSMGALYWQLNDLWPVVSWSSIEYNGTWKLLHYEARRFFAPLRLVAFVRNEHVEVHLLNDTDRRVSGTVVIRGLDWTGTELWRRTVDGDVTPDAASTVWSLPARDLPFDRTDAFLVVSWEGTDPVSGDYLLLTEFKSVPLRRPTVTTVVGDGSVDITVTGAPAFWLTIELEWTGSGTQRRSGDRAGDGARNGTDFATTSADVPEALSSAPSPTLQPEDNGLFLLPGETRRVGIPRGTTIAAVRTIADAY